MTAWATWTRPIYTTVYAEVFYHNHTPTTINFDVQDVPYNLYFTNSSLVNGFTVTKGFLENSYLNVTYSGTYSACFSASGAGQNNHEYFTTIVLNDVLQDKCGAHKKMSADGDIVTLNGCCLLALQKHDKIELSTRDYTGTGAGYYYSMNLNLLMIGP